MMNMKVEVVGGECIEEGRGLYGCQSSQVVIIIEVRCKKLAVISYTLQNGEESNIYGITVAESILYTA